MAHELPKKAADVTRFWLGRSGARRLLGLAIRGRAGENILHRRERHPLLAENLLTGKAAKSSNKKNRKEKSNVRVIARPLG